MLVNFKFQPTLQNDLVLLRPLLQSDFDSLYKVASDPLIWEQHPSKERSQLKGFTDFFNTAIQSQTAFAIIDITTQEIIGSSRYTLIEEIPNSISIGFTFLARKYWGKGYNKSFKTLMIDYAFQYFDIILFYVDIHNFRSQKAVEKLGAVRIHTYKGKTLTQRPNAGAIFILDKNSFDAVR
ncbi:MAG: GNAT family N-acetyltransferase [Chitinophagales bacterium]|nr:GNAT family N-acetyltransferase [Bacteroidota bacterium]